ncbi:MAG TPA: hypothetical protein ENJ98_07505 [Thiolapillus brandeum]|uniref:Ysc84 actin-binding domain-containing protein n=1 Tax=Thiolapillus brandeum TaxID=1076588 RepID=A0A7C5J1E7_9GAMM|nr:hypothetical protein [Thiolapillus brandeum]
MRTTIVRSVVSMVLMMVAGLALADEYEAAIRMFKDADASARFFETSYGYAVFPTVGKGGIGVGGAYGKGRVYAQGRYVGDSSVTQVSLGFQLGGQAFSEIVFFEDERAFREFTSGNFEFGAGAGVVVITAAAQAQATTAGSSATVSGGPNNAETMGNRYNKGMATFIIPKGGLMYEATVSGQKFTYTPRN